MSEYKPLSRKENALVVRAQLIEQAAICVLNLLRRQVLAGMAYVCPDPAAQNIVLVVAEGVASRVEVVARVIGDVADAVLSAAFGLTEACRRISRGWELNK
jgi:hypothetical protein